MNKKVRVRFAPSPTGPLHIGGVRTALYNFLFARQNKGTFILRIEDTDQSRYVVGAEEYIIESLQWLGIEIDEGVGVGGPHEPYRQSERKEIYKNYVQILLEKGMAYYAFDTAEELENLRKSFEKEGKVFSYDHSIRENKDLVRNSFTLKDAEVRELIEKNVPYVIRFKVNPSEEIEVYDLIRENVSFNSSVVDDKVLFKSDGLPTYHLANIVDDHLMEISHVIRGEEWLPSLPLHVLLYRAFNWEMPQFAHLPLILKPNGKGKLSKRDGDQGGFPVFPIEWKSPEGEIYNGYRESGYLPEAVVNMLALLGWNPGTDQEIFTMHELISAFSLEKIQKGGSRFDPEKAKWFNQQHIRLKSNQELAVIAQSILIGNGINVDIEKISQLIPLVKDRITFTTDFLSELSYFFRKPKNYDEQAIKKILIPELVTLLTEIIEELKKIEPFTSQNIENGLKEFAKKFEISPGKIFNPIRILIVGSSKGPHLMDILQILGKEETISRIQDGIEFLKRNLDNKTNF